MQQQQDLIFGYRFSGNSMENGNEEPSNGEVTRRHMRTSALDGQQRLGQAPDQPIFWLSPQTYPPQNGNPRQVASPEEETMRPHIEENRLVPLRPFSALIAQKPENSNVPVGTVQGIAPRPAPVEANRVRKTQLENEAVIKPPAMEHSPVEMLLSATRRIYAGLAGTVAIGAGASIIAILAFQLLISLNYYESPGLSGVQLPDGSTPQILRDVSTVLCSIALTLSLCAILSSFLHFYLSLRILSHWSGTPGWREKIALYHNRSMYVRALSNGGFFVSIIIYMLSLLMYQQLLGATYGSFVLATIISVVIAAGALYCVVVLATGLYFAGVCQEIQSNIRRKGQHADTRGTLV